MANGVLVQHRCWPYDESARPCRACFSIEGSSHSAHVPAQSIPICDILGGLGNKEKKRPPSGFLKAFGAGPPRGGSYRRCRIPENKLCFGALDRAYSIRGTRSKCRSSDNHYPTFVLISSRTPTTPVGHVTKLQPTGLGYPELRAAFRTVTGPALLEQAQMARLRSAVGSALRELSIMNEA